jgi:hypothetical protein
MNSWQVGRSESLPVSVKGLHHVDLRPEAVGGDLYDTTVAQERVGNGLGCGRRERTRPLATAGLHSQGLQSFWPKPTSLPQKWCA